MKDAIEKKLLTIMLEAEDYLTSKELAVLSGVSQKTIQNKMKELRKDVLQFGAELQTKKSRGFLLHMLDRKNLENYLQEEKNDYKEDEERFYQILQELLFANDYIKAEQLCESLYISKSTLTYELNDIRKYLKQFNLNLEQKPYYGLKIQGNEFYLRLCMADLFINRSDLICSQEHSEMNIAYLKALLSECLKNSPYDMNDASLDTLAIHIHVAAQRITHGILIDTDKNLLEIPNDTVVMEIAHTIADKLEEAFHITMPMGEIVYLAVHLDGKRVYHEQDVQVITPRINNMVDEILDAIKAKKNIDLRDDLDLRMMLALHMVPLYTRMKYNMILRNPLLDEIKLHLLDAYELAICACDCIQKDVQAKLSEDEISYFALHFDIAIHRQKENIEKKNILIVCSSGKASAQLLEYKFKSHFSLFIQHLQTCKLSDLSQIDIKDFDVIFTTIKIPQKLTIPVFEVQYLLGKEEIEKITKILKKEETTDDNILSCFDERLFFQGLSFANKEEALYYLVQEIQKVRQLPDGFYEEIMKRENFGATDLIHNVAFPHPNTSLTEDTFFAIAVLKKPILWSKHKVRLIFLASMSNKENLITDLYTKIVAELLCSQTALQEIIDCPEYETLVRIMKDICKKEGIVC